MDPPEAEPFGQVRLETAVSPDKTRAPRPDIAEIAERIRSGRLPAEAEAVAHAIGNDRLDEAEASLRALLQQNGGSSGTEAALRTELGILLAHQDRSDEAKALFQAAAQLDPDHPAAYQELGRLVLAEGRLAPAVLHLRRAAMLGDLDRDLALRLADVEARGGRIDAAKAQLRSLVARYDSTRAHLRLASLAERERNPKLALDHTLKALGRAPASRQVLEAHLRACFRAGLPANAARTVETLVRMFPNEAEYRFHLGEVRASLGQVGEAAEDFAVALELDSEHDRARLALAMAHNHEARYEESRALLEHYLLEHDHDLDARAALAEAEERLDAVEAAETRARGVLAASPRHARANLVVAMVEIRNGRFAEARQALETAVTTDPSLTKAHYQLSFACARLGDRECSRHHLALYRHAKKGKEGTVTTLSATASKAGAATETSTSRPLDLQPMQLSNGATAGKNEEEVGSEKEEGEGGGR